MSIGAELPVWSIFPFAGMLLAIALMPLFAPHFWESNLRKGLVSAIFAAPVAVLLIAGFGVEGAHELLEKSKEYASFILLLLALFTISGGIVVRGSLSGTPLLNTAILAIGALIASVIGTTGASMLLIRPLLRANGPRQRKVHIVVFFIFIVSNCGGLLTPLGDPPLFLGYLKGVPFMWTLSLWKEWLFVNGVLLVLFNVWDQQVFNAEEAARPGSQLEAVMHHEPLAIEGNSNFAFLAAVVATIYVSGRGFANGGVPWPFGVQEGIMAALTLAAFRLTPARLRTANGFTWGPIVEVAVLFAGIFATMAPALLLLNARATNLGVREPWQFFWASGLLSSFLDNAPTYMTFAAAASGLHGIPVEGRYLAELLAIGRPGAELVAAIACGSVMMGANSYIGNGPNFMVRSIAEGSGIRMPSFFGYMLYSVGILIPIFVAVTFVFFV
jgi:Na+/H+ antiporter NhaD/arsenite permease-like protein